MWAKQVWKFAHHRGRWHWFEVETRETHEGLYVALCDKGWAIWGGYIPRMMVTRKQPRHADRCKRCVAALKRREKDEDAKR